MNDNYMKTILSGVKEWTENLTDDAIDKANNALEQANKSIDKALFVVNVRRKSGSTFSADKTYDEIFQAYNEGKYNIVAVYNSLIFPLVLCSVEHGLAAFSMIWDGSYAEFLINPNNEVIRTQVLLATTKSKLPNPHPLTFTGAVSETYDGSSAKTIEIPSGGGGGYNELTLLADINFDGNTANAFEYTGLDDVSEIYIVGGEIKSALDNAPSEFTLDINDICIAASSVMTIQKASGTDTWNEYNILRFNGAFWESLRSPNHGGALAVNHVNSAKYPNSVVLDVGKAKKLKLYVPNPAHKPVTGWMKIWVR